MFGSKYLSTGVWVVELGIGLGLEYWNVVIRVIATVSIKESGRVQVLKFWSKIINVRIRLVLGLKIVL